MAADPSSPTCAEPRADGRSSGRGGRRLTLWGVAIVVIAVSLFGGHHTSDGSPQASRAAGSSAAAQVDPHQSDPQQSDPHKADPQLVEPQRTDPQQADPQQDDAELPRSTPTRLLIPKIAVFFRSCGPRVKIQPCTRSRTASGATPP